MDLVEISHAAAVAVKSPLFMALPRKRQDAFRAAIGSATRWKDLSIEDAAWLRVLSGSRKNWS